MFNKFMEKALVIGVFIFSMLAKLYIMVTDPRKTSKLEKLLNLILTGFGSSLVIYCLCFMKLPMWLFCSIGGFSGIVVTPIALVLSREITPFLNICAEGVETLAKKWFSKKK